MNAIRGWASFLSIFAAFMVVLLVIFFRAYAESGHSYGVDFFFLTYPGLIVAMSSGFLGATFSMLLQTRRRAAEGTLEDVTSASSWQSLLVRSAVGFGAAAILYFFFQSGLLEGSLWPDLGELGFKKMNAAKNGLVPNQHWCLLIIWCFIAGFSETFVPNILAKTEKNAETV